MLFPAQLQTFTIGHSRLEIYVPQPEAIKNAYTANKEGAYWAQVWPAAIGLCRFLQAHPQYCTNKKILELAAGLGVPGLFAAGLAHNVTITDIMPQAIAYITASATHLQLTNVQACSLDWQLAPQLPLPDVVLLSDVNYEPAIFEQLYTVLHYFINHRVTVIISTPQRLVAKAFMVQLLPFVVMQWQNTVQQEGNKTEVSVFVLADM